MQILKLSSIALLAFGLALSGCGDDDSNDGGDNAGNNGGDNVGNNGGDNAGNNGGDNAGNNGGDNAGNNGGDNAGNNGDNNCALPDVGGATGALVFTTDNSAGNLEWLDFTDQTVTDLDIAVHSDARLIDNGGTPWVINRLGRDSLLALDPANDYAITAEHSAGAGTNPHSFVEVDGRLYISRYGDAEMLVIDATSGDEIATIDLSVFADGDGVPEMTHSILDAQGRLWVLLQLLDQDNGFVPSGNSLLARIDTATNAIVDLDADTDGDQAFELSAQNPFEAWLDADTQMLYISMVGGFGAPDGGLLKVDLSGDAPVDGGLVFTEENLGGDIAFALRVGEGDWVVSGNDAAFNTKVWRGNADGFEVIYESEGFNLGGIAVAGAAVLIADRVAGQEGVAVYSTTDSCLVTETPLPTALAPSVFLVR